MPKFSAYMRGEEGPQGDVGQAVLLNGIVSSSSELPPNTQNQKNNTQNARHARRKLWLLAANSAALGSRCRF